MVGPELLDDPVLRKRQASRLGDLLKRRLVVLEEQVTSVDPLQIRIERREDERARGVDPAVEIDGRNDRLEYVRQERVFASAARLLFADAEQKHLSHTGEARLRRQRRGTDHERLDLRKSPLVELGESPE